MEELLKQIIKNKTGVKEENIQIIIDEEEGRYWINVLNENYTGDLDDDPLLEQYVLVPISKIQDRLEIIL